jgi:ketosteroid isomerase-like protein
MTHAEAVVFAREWVAAWNAHDLDRVLGHYADDFEMTSPYIVTLSGEPGGTLKGKAAVGAYWREALRRFPDLRFVLKGVFAGVDSVAICYEGARGVRACEVLIFGFEGRVTKAVANYES